MTLWREEVDAQLDAASIAALLTMPIPEIPSPAVPYGSWIVVTGATGFIGSHVVDQALAAGYSVRGTTRDTEKNRWVADHFEKQYGTGRFELVQVKDVKAKGAFDDAVNGCKGVIHVAHDMTGTNDPRIDLPRSIDVAINALESAVKAGIKRFVYTSSSFAVTQPRPDKVFWVDESTFNDEAVLACIVDEDVDGSTIYAASKVVTERAIRHWIRDNDADIVVNMLCPNCNVGPIINPEKQGHPTSSSWVANIAKGNYEAVSKAGPEQYINVQDDAKLHVIALADPEVVNRRIIGMVGEISGPKIVAILRKSWPDKIFEDIDNPKQDKTVIKPREEVEALLKKAYGHGYTSLEESVRGNAQDILG